MTKVLSYSIVGLQDYTISFESYCSICDVQKHCKYGKTENFIVSINCGDLNRAKEKIKLEQLQKLQKKADVGASYDDLLKKVKINIQGIFSQIWKDKVKALKDELRCLDARKVDSMLVSQQGQDWWSDFNATMKVINKECEKIA